MSFADAAPLGASEAPTSVLPPASTRTQPAGFWIRVGASLIDGIVTVLIGVVPVAVASGMVAPSAVIGIAVLLLLFMYLGYAPVMLAFNNGATWGKRACEQRVVLDDGRPIGLGRAVLRELVVKGLLGLFVFPYWVSALMVGIRHDKRGLHDLIAGTRVVRDVKAVVS
jgi:uncharacterized RDD family membrane protein YckC